MTATTQALAKGLNSARSSLADFGKSILSFKGLLAGAFTGAGVASLMHFASLADDLSDNIEKLETMFGSASDSIVKQAEKMNAAFGTSEIASTAAAVKMGGLFKSLGIAQGPAAEMTAQLQVLGQAIANFQGITFEAAMAKVQAGMAGKGKALKEFGISVKASMSAQERFNALMSGGADVIGAMGTRAMDAGAAWAEFRGRIEQVEIEIGKNLPELVEPFFQQLNTGVVAAIEYFKSLKGSTLDWGESTLAAGKSAAEGVGVVQTAVGFLANSWQLVSAGFHAFRASFTEGLAVIVGGISRVVKGIDWIMEKMGLVEKGEGSNVMAFLDAWAEGLHDAASKEMEGVHKEWAKPWSSEGIDASFAAARKKIEEARKAVVKPALAAAAAAGAKPAAMPSAAKAAGAALAIGSAEAASVIIKSRYGIGDDKDMKKVAKNSDKQVELLQDIKSELENGDGAEVLDDF